MAFRVGITGLPNTGKSFAWKHYNGDDVFAICPSSKIVHIRKSDNKLPELVNITIKGKSQQEVMQEKNYKTVAHLMNALSISGLSKSDVQVTGDYVICSDVRLVSGVKKFVDNYMPIKKILLTPDFTHYVNYIMQSQEFRNRKIGSEAFAKYVDMAADMLANIILTADELTNIQLDFTEFHSEYNAELDDYQIFTPGGKMLTEKFKPGSYFDVMLYTYVFPYEEEKDEAKRFKFVTIKRDGYDGRGMGLFTDVAVEGRIPNNMTLVIERLRKYLGYE